MKIGRTRSTSAGTLVPVLLLVGVACMVSASFLSLATQRNAVALRSMAWNDALAVAEAGIEEGLAQIQYSKAPTNGWTASSGTAYQKTRMNPFGDNSAYYTAVILNTNPPVVTATGYVRAPGRYGYDGYISRVVRVWTTAGTNQYPYAIKAKTTINMTGISVADSFDSSDPNYSLNGQYNPLAHKANCYVVSQSSAAGTMSVGNGTIFGYVETGPGGGTLTINNGVVGDNNWASNTLNRGTIQAGHFATNYNKDIVDVVVPPGMQAAASGPSSGAYTVAGTNYQYCLGNVTNVYNGNLSLPGPGSLVVTGHATLYVLGSFSMSGTAFIYITTNASLRLYVGTTNAAAKDDINVTGSGVINGSGYAENFTIYGLPSVSKVTYAGTSTFIGVLDAPRASVAITGNADFMGAIVANDVSLTGGGAFHYDEHLGGVPYPKYQVLVWREL